MKKYLFGIKVMPKDVVLDSQGRALHQVLNQNQMVIESARVGKFFEISIESADLNSAKMQADKISKSVLINDLIEKFEILETKEI